MGRPPLKNSLNISVEIFPANQRRPEFGNESFSGVPVQVPVNYGLGQPFFQISAGIPPGIRYEIVNGNPQQLFSMEPETGKISFARPPNPSEYGKIFTLRIRATQISTAETDEISIRIAVPDYSAILDPSQEFLKLPEGPIFTSKSFVVDVPENLPGPILIMDVNSTLEQNGIPVEYKILSGSDSFFAIDSENGKIFATRPLDREKKTHHVMIIEATPRGAVPPSLRLRRQSDRIVSWAGKFQKIFKKKSKKFLIFKNLFNFRD